MNPGLSDPRAVPSAALGGRKEGQRFPKLSKVLRGPRSLVITFAITEHWRERHPRSPCDLISGRKNMDGKRPFLLCILS